MSVEWTEAEDKRLITELPTIGAQKMAARLGKSIWHTRKRARQLGVKWSKPTIWKGEKLKRMVADYYSLGGPATSAKYGISTSHITSIIFRAGLQRPSWKWKKWEDKIIITLFPHAPYSEILPKLPGRTVNAIRKRASQLKVRRPNTRFKDSWQHERSKQKAS